MVPEWHLKAANPAFDVSQASLAQRFKVPRFRLRLAQPCPTLVCVGGCERVLDVWQEGSSQLGPVENGVEPQAPEIQGCWCWAPDLSLLLRPSVGCGRGLALMISPVDVSTSVCLSRDADDSLCKHPALTLPRNPRG